jgi:glycerol kinase
MELTMDGLILGLDHGGTTTTALLLDPAKGSLASASVAMPKQTPRPDYVEHHAEDFLSSSLAAAAQALGKAGRKWSDVSAIGIANQGETSMAWSSASHEVFGPAISWEDRRTAGFCTELARNGVDALVRERTGILLDPYFSASKFHWLTHENANARHARDSGTLRLGGTDSFVINRLTGGAVHASDPGTASRTALFNIRQRCWDADLLAAFDVDEAALPGLRDSAGDFGHVRHPDVPAKAIRITADAVDAHAALFAQGCWDRTSVKATYGTGAFIEVNTGRDLIEPDGKLPVFVAWQLGGSASYTIEGSVFAVGSAISWAVSAGLLDSAAQSAQLAASVPDADGVVFVPAFTGLAAPHWVPTARASLHGLSLSAGKAHIARALLDSIAFCCGDVILALNARLGGSLQTVKADGGPTRNAYLMQRQADMLGMPVHVSEEPDMTAMGAALLAAVGANQLTLDDMRMMRRKTRIFEPLLSADAREEAWAEWRKAIADVIERSKT